jgi:tetratricopeptide (TPR) repeat protein
MYYGSGLSSRSRALFAGLFFLAAALSAPVIGHAQEGFETAEILFTRAVLAYDEGKYAEALRDLLKAHELDAGNINAIYYLGATYDAQGNFAQAERYLRQGLALEPQNADLRYELGVALYGQKRYDDALKEFLALYQAAPQKDNLGHYIGLCYYQKKDYETAITYFRRNVSPDVRTRQVNQYYLGLALRETGRDTEAIEELTEAVRIEPAAPIVGAAQQLLTAIREQTGAKRLRLQLTLNSHYDTNPAGEHISKASGGNLFNARADYTVYRSGPWESTVSYSLLQTLNYRKHHSDLNDNLLGTDLYYKSVLAGMPTNTGLQLSNDILLLGGRKYLQRPTGTVSFTLQEDLSNFTTAIFRPQYKDFFLRGVSEKRDALNHLVGLVHYVRFGGGQYQVNFGYHFDNEDASSPDWSYVGHKAVAGLVLGLPWGLQASSNAEYHARTYGTQRIIGGSRRDDEVILLTAVSKDIMPNLTLTLQHLWDRNYSKIFIFDTKRHVAALGVTWRY